MTFGSPLLLIGLALVPLGAIAYALFDRRARRSAGEHVARPLRRSVLPRSVSWRRHVPIAGGLAAGALVIVALAHPQKSVAIPTEQARIVVMTDRSGSMLAKDVRPNRLTAAREAAVAFLSKVPSSVRVGAITFNQNPTVLASPTRDHGSVRDAIQTIKAAGSTASGDALTAALKMLSGQRTPSAIVLLSDGKNVRGRDIIAAARAAKAAKVPVYTVSLGTQSGTITTKTGTSRVPPDTATLRRVAQITGGKSYAISDAGALKAVYQKLGSKLATERVPRDVSSSFAGAALLALVAFTLAGLRLTGRPL